MTTEELKKRSVINVRDASDYGCPTGFRVDVCSGNLTHIIVSRRTGLLSLKCSGDMEIPWCAVVRIGEGAILVDVPAPTRCESCGKPSKKHNPFF